MEAANLPTFPNFGNANTSDTCVIFAKNHVWPRNWGLEQNWGACVPPEPGPKTATDCGSLYRAITG